MTQIMWKNATCQARGISKYFLTWLKEHTVCYIRENVSLKNKKIVFDDIPLARITGQLHSFDVSRKANHYLLTTNSIQGEVSYFEN